VTYQTPTIHINGEPLSPGEVESLRCAVTEFHGEMCDPLALGNDEHGRTMTRLYRENMERILVLMGVISE
jgi:hypothetical protein